MCDVYFQPVINMEGILDSSFYALLPSKTKVNNTLRESLRKNICRSAAPQNFYVFAEKTLRLIDYGLFAEETFADLGKKHKLQNFLPQTLSSLKVVATL